MNEPRSDLKSRVREHWESEPCGTRGEEEHRDRKLYFERLSRMRYEAEPYIPSFAEFPSAKGKRILEIGVGGGADFENWCAQATHATGVDLTEAGIALTRERLALGDVPSSRYELRTADAENLPFEDGRFDLVYSWGVLHHTPDTPRAFREAFRVLAPGGVLEAMVYHVPSWTGWMLRVRNGVLRGKLGLTAKEAMFRHLESPGTKAYTVGEGRRLVEDAGFEGVELTTRLSAGDLLSMRRSAKYGGLLDRALWQLYPRWLVRALGDRFGLYLLIRARKPGP